MLNNKKDILNRFFVFLGLLLTLGSLAFLFLNQRRINADKKEALQLENQFIQYALSNQKKDYQASTDSDKLLLGAVGVMRIDKLDIVLPIYANTDKTTLLKGVGIVEDTDLPTSQKNTISVLAGHRGGTREIQSFLNINQLKKGDNIKITTKEEVLNYKVVGQEVIEPTDWSKFTREKDKTKLYLLTCHPYPINNKRLLVKAELTETLSNE